MAAFAKSERVFETLIDEADLSVHEHVGVGTGRVGTGEVSGTARWAAAVRPADVVVSDGRHRLVVEAVPARTRHRSHFTTAPK